MKTILIHFTSESDVEGTMKKIIPFVKAQNAYLVGLFSIGYLQVYTYVGGPMGTGGYFHHSKDFDQAQKESAAAGKAIFEACCNDAEISHEWREEEGIELNGIVRSARLADLIVVSDQANERNTSGLNKYLISDLLRASSAPILAIPRGASAIALGNAIVTWKDCKESASATRSFTHFLDDTAKIKVLTVSGKKETTAFGDLDASFLASYLARHGIAVDVVHKEAGGSKTGATILQSADELKADILVMGAYSRLRITEQLFGGVTEHVLNNTAVPLFIAA